MKRFIALVTACCALGLAAPVYAEETLVIYSGRSDKFVKPAVDEFSKRTGIKIILHNAKSTALLNKLRVEKDRTEADLFLSNDAGNLQTGSQLGLFQPINETLISVIDPKLRAPDHTWVGLSARARVLVVNNNSKEAATVKSVFDLADKRFKDRLAITDSTNESYIAGVTVYMEAAGEARTRKWLKGMKRNVNGKVFAKHSKIVQAVAAGKKDVGLVNHYYIYRHLAKEPNAPIRIVLPDQGDKGIGVAWNVAGIAISKYSKNRELAEKFIGFLVSEEGQKMFAGANREYPTRKGVKASPEVPAAGSYKVANVPMYQLFKQRTHTIDLIESVGMP